MHAGLAHLPGDDHYPRTAELFPSPVHHPVRLSQPVYGFPTTVPGRRAAGSASDQAASQFVAVPGMGSGVYTLEDQVLSADQVRANPICSPLPSLPPLMSLSPSLRSFATLCFVRPTRFPSGRCRPSRASQR